MATQTNQKLRKVHTMSSSSGKGTSGPIRATVSYRLMLTTPPSVSSQQGGGTTVHDRGSIGSKGSSCNALKDLAKEQHRLFSTDGQSVEVGKPSDRLQRSAIHRSSSFDTIVNYLNGEWPTTEPLLQENGYACADETTQTPEHWQKSSGLSNGRPPGTPISVPAASHRRSSSLGNRDNVRDFKARLSKSRKDGRGTPGAVSTAPLRASSSSQSTVSATSQNGHRTPPTPKNIRVVTLEKQRGFRRHSRGSLEGLNQEIEKMDLNLMRSKEGNRDGPCQPSGRCAPVVNLLTAITPVVAVNVISQSDTTLERSCFQRPHDDDATPTNGYLSPAAVNSPPLSAVTDVVDRQQVPSPKSSPAVEDYASPVTMKFRDEISPRKLQPVEDEVLSDILDRRPPDGCEKIELQEQENLSSKSGVAKILRPIPTKMAPAAVPQRVDPLHPPLYKQYVCQPHAGPHQATQQYAADQQYIISQQYASQQSAGHQPTKLFFNCSAFQLVKKRTQ